MKYDLHHPASITEAELYFEKLKKQEKFIEIREIRKAMSQSQRGYLHILLTSVAIEYGETLEYVKQVIFKQWINPEIFHSQFANRKTGEIRENWRSTEDLDTKEMTTSIERLRNWASQNMGLYLPEPFEEEQLKALECEAERYAEYI